MVNAWTRNDLPGVHWPGIHGESERQGAEKALDAVVEHLNAHHPKPERSRDLRQDAAAFEQSFIDERARAERAERERDEALRKKGEAFDRTVRAERERDEWKARAEAAEELAAHD